MRAALALFALACVGCASAKPLPAARAVAATSSPVAKPVTKAAPLAEAPTQAVDAADMLDIERRLADMQASRGRSTPRSRVVPEAFQLSDLPVASIPEPLLTTSNVYVSSGVEAAELTRESNGVSLPSGPNTFEQAKSIRIGVAGRVFGRIRIGYTGGTVDLHGGGVFISCGGPTPVRRKLLPARWETLEPTPKGGVLYKVVNAWFDTQTCTASVVERASVMPVPLLGGAFHAFRQIASGVDAQELIVVLGPQFMSLSSAAVGGDTTTLTSPFARIVLPSRRGGGASVVGRMNASALGEWEALMGPLGLPERDMVVGLEIAQGVSDAAPIAIAYMAVPRMNGPTIVQAPPQPRLVDPFASRK